MKNYYQILGVPQNASEAKIKQAYRARIKRVHPDINKSASAGAQTRDLNEAWSVLSDPLARMSYDIDMNLPVSGLADFRAEKSAGTKPGAGAKKRPIVFCEKCGRVDATVHAAPILPVYNFFSFSSKAPVLKNLCSGCRMRESRATSTFTRVLVGIGVMVVFWLIEMLVVRGL